MSNYLFSKKIICKSCNRRFKGKTEYGKKIYLCSTYSNFGKDKCTRQAIYESELLERVQKHMEIAKMNARREGRGDIHLDVQTYVDHIERNGEEYTIFYSDGTKTLVKDKHIIF